MSASHSAPKPLVEKAAVQKAFIVESGVLFTAGLVFALLSPALAVPAISGALVSLLAGAYFIWRFYQPAPRSGKARAGHMVAAMQRAETGKFFITLFSLAALFMVFGTKGAPLVLAGYGFAMLSQILARFGMFALQDKSASSRQHHTSKDDVSKN